MVPLVGIELTTYRLQGGVRLAKPSENLETFLNCIQNRSFKFA